MFEKTHLYRIGGACVHYSGCDGFQKVATQKRKAYVFILTHLQPEIISSLIIKIMFH